MLECFFRHSVQLVVQVWVMVECADRLPSYSQLTSSSLALLSLAGTYSQCTAGGAGMGDGGVC